jgi:hypothetical protein
MQQAGLKERRNGRTSAGAANGHGTQPAAAGDLAATAEKIDLTQGFDRVWENPAPDLPPTAAGRGAAGVEGSQGDQPPAA